MESEDTVGPGAAEEASEADESTVQETTGRDAPPPDDRNSGAGARLRRRGLGESAVKVRTIVATGLVLVVVAGFGALTWQWQAKSNEVDSMNSRAADNGHAEQTALDYAVAAADMDFHDLAAWRARLTKGTSPELSNKLSQAASSMEQIIVPLQWVSTSTPITSKVRSEANGAYSVDCFVSVLTKNSQAPDGIQSTATYRLTVDSAHGWAITDVGGIGAALAAK